jgi:hypothetical protein
VTLVAQGAEYAAAEATAVAHDNMRAVPVFISGATGVNAAFINGFFEPTQEKGLDGRLILTKRGDAGMMMEHVNGFWHVKAVSNKGTGICYAYVEGGCALAACTSRQWRVSFDGKTFSDAPGVKMVTESEVCCSRTRVFEFHLRSHPHCFPPHSFLKAKPRPLLKPRSKPNTVALLTCCSASTCSSTYPNSC